MGKLPTLIEFEAMRLQGKGFTRDLLASWGVAWPPKKGWAKKFATKLRKGAKGEVKPSRNPFEKVRSRSEKDAFYLTWEWKKLRMKAFERDGRRCVCCGATPDDGVRLVVDHIKPLGEFWSLRLELSNTQVLCNDCNMGKGNWLHKDFKAEADTTPPRPNDDWLTEEFKAIIG